MSLSQSCDKSIEFPFIWSVSGIFFHFDIIRSGKPPNFIVKLLLAITCHSQRIDIHAYITSSTAWLDELLDLTIYIVSTSRPHWLRHFPELTPRLVFPLEIFNYGFCEIDCLSFGALIDLLDFIDIEVLDITKDLVIFVEKG